MLTRKQQELLTFIRARVAENDGIAPSFEEMKDAVGLKSKSGIHRLITALEERGFIRRLPHRARAIEVLRLPDGTPVAPAIAFAPTDLLVAGDAAGAPPVPPRARGRQPARPPVLTGRVEEDRRTVALPLYGRIAAGTPIEALADPDETIEVPSHVVGDGEHYALTVSGDSMIEAGILDGDVAIVRRTEKAENGAIVVALIEEHETTLKRLRARGDKVALEPANPTYETRIFPAAHVRIQGRLVALFRTY